MRAELKRLQRRLKTTTIYVTHDQVEAMTMVDRIAILDKGHLQQLGSPNEVYTRPKNTFVAGFIGNPAMNLVSCTYVEKDERGFLDAGDFIIDVTDLKDVIKEKATRSEMLSGIRPEHIKVYKKRPSKEAIRATIYVEEPLGAELLLSLKVGNNIFKAKERADFKADIEEEVWMTFNKKNICIFDKKQEKAII